MYECYTCADTGRWTGWYEANDGTKTLLGDAPCPRKCRFSRMTELQIEADRVARMFDSDGVPIKLAKASMHNLWQSNDVVSRALGAVASGRNVILHGPSGTGKSWLAVALMRGQIEAGVAGLFANVPGLLNRIRRSYGERGNNNDDLVEAAITVPLLVLDDCGRERVTDWTVDTMYRIANGRNASELPTIITTNTTTAELSTVLTYPVYSRFRENAEMIEIGGKDRRAVR